MRVGVVLLLLGLAGCTETPRAEPQDDHWQRSAAEWSSKAWSNLYRIQAICGRFSFNALNAHAAPSESEANANKKKHPEWAKACAAAHQMPDVVSDTQRAYDVGKKYRR